MLAKGIEHHAVSITLFLVTFSMMLWPACVVPGVKTPEADQLIATSWLAAAAGFCPMERDESSWDRAKSLSWLHLLAAVPILMAHVATMHPRRLLAATQTATIALALMELNKRRWEPLLES